MKTFPQFGFQNREIAIHRMMLSKEQQRRPLLIFAKYISYFSLKKLGKVYHDVLEGIQMLISVKE